MPLIIDGHNLIPKVPGINLSDLDDEMRLVEILQDYARLKRRGRIDVFFDRAPSGHPRSRKFGSVSVVFAKPGKTADYEIEVRLAQLGKSARNWIVISSDQRVRRAARAVGAEDMSSEVFANEIQQVLSQRNAANEMAEDKILNPDEIEMWMEMFKEQKLRKNDKS